MSDDRDHQQRTAHIHVEGVGTFQVPAGSTLRGALRQEGVFIDGTCADKGICGRCIVKVLKGDPGEPSPQEKGLLLSRSAGPGSRLACRIIVTGDLSISVDREHLLEIDRTGRWKEVWGSPLWMPEGIRRDAEGPGIAVDLGTTSIAACLMDLSQARPLDLQTAANPQIPWGDEIISRLGAAAGDEETAVQLSVVVWEAVRNLVRSLCARNGVSSGRISRMVVVGNSAMVDLSLGLPVQGLLTPPYAPCSRSPQRLPADQLPVSLELSRDAVVYFPALVGGYAGSDALASLVAAAKAGVGTGALLDVGTNTEIAVWKEEAVAVATAPSGPAFEGGHIRFGMRAEKGAVWKVAIDEDKVATEVVGGGPARGICGTGMIDAIASMLRRGILEPSGLMIEGSHPSVKGGALVLTEDGRIVLEGEDVATVQKAKAAVAATLQTVLEELGVGKKDLERIFLAGAFGSRLNIDNAMATGLLPSLPANRYTLAGNTALVGASMMLVSEEEQRKGEQVGRIARHCDVAQDPDFEETFIDNLFFPKSR